MLTIVCIFFVSLAMCTICHKRISATLLPASCLCILIGYVLALTGKLQWWNSISIIIMAISIFAIVIRRNMICDAFNLGILLFFIYYSLVFILCRNLTITEWDDLSHWGTIVKQIYYLKAIPTAVNSASQYSDYPPAAAVWINLFLCNYNMYRESLVFGAWNLLLGMCLLPFWEKIERKNKCYINLLLLLLCILLPFAMTPTCYRNLQVDWLVALMVLYSLCHIITNERVGGEELCELCLVLGTLSLVKAVSIILVVEVMIITSIIIFGEKHHYMTIYRKALELVIMAFAIVTVWISWKRFCLIGGNSSYTNDSFKNLGFKEFRTSMYWFIKEMPIWVRLFLIISVVILVLLHSQKKQILVIAKALSVINMFLIIWGVNCCNIWVENDALIDDFAYISQHYWYGFINWGGAVDHGGLFSVVECLGFSILLVTLAKGNIDNFIYSRVLLVFEVLCIVTILYMVYHLAMYFFMFFGSEREVLSAFTRYLAMVEVPIVGVALFTMVLAKSDFGWKNALSKCLPLFFVLMMINFTYFLQVFGLVDAEGTYIETSLSNRRNAERIVNEINNCVDLKASDSCCLITGGFALVEANSLRYLLLPAIVNNWGIDASNYAPDDMKDFLNNCSYDYVFVEMSHVNPKICESDVFKGTDFFPINTHHREILVLSSRK